MIGQQAAEGLVARILYSSAVDGPGNRAVVFLQGCDFDCAYCHNPETRNLCDHCGACVGACPAGALSIAEGGGEGGERRVVWDETVCRDCGACVRACPKGSSPKTRRMTAAEILARLERRKPFLSGITVSGGECGLQAAFLEELAVAARAAGLPALIDTNGSTDYSARPRLVEAAEGFMLDVKAWDQGVHRALTLAGNDAVKRNLDYLAGAGKLAEVRVVVAPGLVDAEACVRGIAEVLRTAGAAGRTVLKLIAFRREGVRPARVAHPGPDREELEALAALARSEGIGNVVIV